MTTNPTIILNAVYTRGINEPDDLEVITDGLPQSETFINQLILNNLNPKKV